MSTKTFECKKCGCGFAEQILDGKDANDPKLNYKLCDKCYKN